MFQERGQTPPPSAGTPGEAGTRPQSSEPLDWNLVAITAAIWRHKLMVLGIAAVAFLAMLLFLAVTPAQYTASTQILIDPSDLKVVDNGLTSQPQTNDIALLQVESQVRVLGSNSVLAPVVASEHLDTDPEFGGGPPSLLRTIATDLFGLVGLSPSARPAPSLIALDQLRRRLKISRADRTYVVDVAVTTRSRETSVRIANAIADSYIATQVTARADAARRATEQLTARLNELRTKVRQAEERVEAYKAKNNITVSTGQLVNEQQVTDLNNQLAIARARTSEAKARYDLATRLQKSGDPSTSNEALQSPTITALRSQYAEMQRRLNEQSSTLGPRHPAVIEAQAQAEGMRRVIADEISRIQRAAANDYARAKDNETSLNTTLDQLKKTSITTSEAMVPLRELEREVAASRQIYEAFLARSRETGEQETLDTKNIRVITKAEAPLRRSSPPNDILMLAAAIIAGAGLGMMIALAIEVTKGMQPAASPAVAARETPPAAAPREAPPAPTPVVVSPPPLAPVPPAPVPPPVRASAPPPPVTASPSVVPESAPGGGRLATLLRRKSGAAPLPAQQETVAEAATPAPARPVTEPAAQARPAPAFASPPQPEPAAPAKPAAPPMPAAASRTASQTWSAETARELTGLPVLAVLPPRAVTHALSTLEDFRTPFAAALRQLDDTLRSGREGRRFTLMVLALRDAENTAKVALNLAAIQAAKHRVLLIDSDLSRRTLATAVSDQPASGLVDVAVGRKSLADVTITDARTHVSLLPLMASNGQRYDDISDQDIRAAFTQTGGYDRVIVAAMDHEADPSARFFADLVDDIVLVLPSTRIDRRAIDSVYSTMGAAVRKIRGSVLMSPQGAEG